MLMSFHKDNLLNENEMIEQAQYELNMNKEIP